MSTPTAKERYRPSEVIKLEGDDITNLKVSPQLVRWGELDQDHVEHLAARIATEGQQTPCKVRKGPDGELELVYGRHRHAAVILINSDIETYHLPKSIPLLCTFSNLSEIDSIKASFSENTGKPLTPVDLAFACYNFQKKYGMKNAEIAGLVSTPHHKINEVRVSQLVSLMRMPDKVLRLLHTGEIPESATRAMLGLGINAEQMEIMADRLETGELRAGQIIAQLAEEKRKKGKKVRRSLKDLLEKLIKIDTTKALDLIAWLDGETNDDKRVDYIFEDEEPLIDLTKVNEDGSQEYQFRQLSAKDKAKEAREKHEREIAAKKVKESKAKTTSSKRGKSKPVIENEEDENEQDNRENFDIDLPEFGDGDSDNDSYELGHYKRLAMGRDE